jgi:hypothetical protein
MAGQVVHARECLAQWIETKSGGGEANMAPPPAFLERPFLDVYFSDLAQPAHDKMVRALWSVPMRRLGGDPSLLLQAANRLSMPVSAILRFQGREALGCPHSLCSACRSPRATPMRSLLLHQRSLSATERCAHTMHAWHAAHPASGECYVGHRCSRSGQGCCPSAAR